MKYKMHIKNDLLLATAGAVLILCTSPVSASDERTHLLRDRGEIQADRKERLDPSMTLVEEVDKYYVPSEGNPHQLSQPTKWGSFAFSGAGMVSLVFLGADVVNRWTKTNTVGFVMGPIFELPIACLAYQAQNALIEESKKAINPQWRKISKRNHLAQLLAKGGGIVVVAGLGTAMATTAVYYTSSYLQPLIGQGALVFLPAAWISNSVMAGVATVGLLKFFKDNIVTYCLKPQETRDQRLRGRIKKCIQDRLQEIENPDFSLESLDSTVREKISLVIVSGLKPDSELSVEAEEPSLASSNSRFSKGQALTGAIGAAVAIVGSYAMLEGTRVASHYILTNWFGCDPSVAEPFSNALGYLGGITMGCYRGLSTKGTFQRLHKMISSCSGQTKVQVRPKEIAGEVANWTLGLASVAPRIQIVLDNVSTGPGQIIVMVGNVIATTCNDYFGWKRVPDVARELVRTPTEKDRMIQALTALMNDMDQLKFEVVEALGECFKIREEESPVKIEEVPEGLPGAAVPA